MPSGVARESEPKPQDFPDKFPVSRENAAGEGFSRDCHHHQFPLKKLVESEVLRDRASLRISPAGSHCAHVRKTAQVRSRLAPPIPAQKSVASELLRARLGRLPFRWCRQSAQRILQTRQPSSTRIRAGPAICVRRPGCAARWSCWTLSSCQGRPRRCILGRLSPPPPRRPLARPAPLVSNRQQRSQLPSAPELAERCA